ncbi:MAG: hypothetical protein ACRBBP_03375 [Bdellovibrionales bacterium]
MTAIFLLLISSVSFSQTVLRPGIPDDVTAVNAASYSLKGYCAIGNGDVTIHFGSTTVTVPCSGVPGAYLYEGDVSGETLINPIRQCVDQVPLVGVCSEYADNDLAPPSLTFDFTPLVLIDSTNVMSYAVSGLCAPKGASVSVDIGAFTGAVSGLCGADNRFVIRDDVTAIPDALGYPVLATIDDGGTTNTASTTVDKSLGGLDPIPFIVSTTASFVDADLDTWIESGDTVDFDVEFSEVVNVGPSVQLVLGLTSGDKAAVYQAGTGTNTITFRLSVTAGDEQCDGRFILKEIDLNGGAVTDASGQDAEFRALSNLLDIEKLDAEVPAFVLPLDILTDDATSLKSVEVGSDNFRGEDNCVATEVRASIGETPGGEEVTPFQVIPSNAFSYVIEDGVDGFSFTLFPSTDYYVSVRAFDQAGNSSATLSTASWVLSPVFTIPNLIVYLDGSDPLSVLDGGGNPSSSGSFDGFVDSFEDTSSSAVVHDFTAMSATQEPSFSMANNSLVFDQTNDCMETPNHSEINTGLVNQRSFSSLFKTGGDVNTLQMIFEEGGSTRGMNLYVYQNNIYCGFWNATNDGDGTQGFISQSAPILANTTYNVTSVFDYTNYTGPAGPNGTFECYINGVSMGSSSSTSRLFGHSGDVSLGCSGDSTRLHTGTSSADFNYGGEIMEFMMFNSPPSSTDATDIYNFLQTKWGF